MPGGKKPTILKIAKNVQKHNCLHLYTLFLFDFAILSLVYMTKSCNKTGINIKYLTHA